MCVGLCVVGVCVVSLRCEQTNTLPHPHMRPFRHRHRHTHTHTHTHSPTPTHESIQTHTHTLTRNKPGAWPTHTYVRIINVELCTKNRASKVTSRNTRKLS